jgi:hypothetical protein
VPDDNSQYQGTTSSVVPTITAGIKGFSPRGLLSCEIREAITELVTFRGEPLYPWAWAQERQIKTRNGTVPKKTTPRGFPCRDACAA